VRRVDVINCLSRWSSKLDTVYEKVAWPLAPSPWRL